MFHRFCPKTAGIHLPWRWVGSGVMVGVMVLAAGCGGRSPSVTAPPEASPAPAPAAASPDAASPDNASPNETDIMEAAEMVGAVETNESEEPGAAATAPVADGTEFYSQGISRGSTAYQIAQTARTPSDWSLVASRWQQAIDLLKAVTPQSANYSQAQAKIQEYQGYVNSASAKANELQGRLDGVTATATAGERRTFRARIVGRNAGTPVILVNINGRDLVPMIVDTGASGVVLTYQVAQQLGVTITGTSYASIANGDVVAFGVGQVQSIDVAGARTENLQVAIAPPNLDIGLLGNSFFSKYNVTVEQDWVVFRER